MKAKVPITINIFPPAADDEGWGVLIENSDLVEPDDERFVHVTMGDLTPEQAFSRAVNWCAARGLAFGVVEINADRLAGEHDHGFKHRARI